MFSVFKNLVGSKMLTKEDLEPALDKMREHLVGKILLEPHCKENSFGFSIRSDTKRPVQSQKKS